MYRRRSQAELERPARGRKGGGVGGEPGRSQALSSETWVLTGKEPGKLVSDGKSPESLRRFSAKGNICPTALLPTGTKGKRTRKIFLRVQI